MKQGLLPRKIIATLMVSSLLLTSGCGYLLYPERQGLKGGRIDPVIAVLDAAGLIFWIVPGVVAFAVDFSNGTIYIPPGGKSALDKHVQAESPQQLQERGWQAVRVKGEMNSESVARTLNETLGTQISASAIQLVTTDRQLAAL